MPADAVAANHCRLGVTADDRNTHREFVQTLGSEAIWRGYANWVFNLTGCIRR
jgi:hypothetical protein